MILDRVKDLKKSMKYTLQVSDELRAEGRLIKDSVTFHGIISVLAMVMGTFLSSCFIRSYIKKKKDK